MKKIMLPVIVPILLLTPYSSSAIKDKLAPVMPVTREEFDDLSDLVKTNDQYRHAGQDQIAQALGKIYEMPDVQAAIKAIPRLTRRADNGDKERRANYDRITGIQYEQVYQDKRLHGLEKANGVQLELLTGLEKGVSRSLQYVEEEKSDNREYRAALYGGAITLGTIFIAWILGKFYHMLTSGTVSAVNSDQADEY